MNQSLLSKDYEKNDYLDSLKNKEEILYFSVNQDEK